MHQHGGQLLQPVSGHLKAGNQTFQLVVPGAKKVFVNDWDAALTKEGDRFTGTVKVKSGSVKVYAQFGGDQGPGGGRVPGALTAGEVCLVTASRPQWNYHG